MSGERARRPLSWDTVRVKGLGIKLNLHYERILE